MCHIWSDIKAKFENEILCPALRGRLHFEYTGCAENIYEETNDSCLFIYTDDILLYKFDTLDYNKQFSNVKEHLQYAVKEILSEKYTSRIMATEASRDIVNELIPWIASQKGLLRAEHAVQIMEIYIKKPKLDFCRDNEFAFVLEFLSKYLDGEVVLNNEDSLKYSYAKTWSYPFIMLRIEAEKQFKRHPSVL